MQRYINIKLAASSIILLLVLVFLVGSLLTKTFLLLLNSGGGSGGGSGSSRCPSDSGFYPSEGCDHYWVYMKKSSTASNYSWGRIDAILWRRT